MPEKTEIPNSKELDIGDLSQGFLTLRIGEEIPRLEIKRIRKVVNKDRKDNLPGVDFKYIIESQEGKILLVNSWILWKAISQAIRAARKINCSLELKHLGHEDYAVRVIDPIN
jgi:hypothetical protein